MNVLRELRERAGLSPDCLSAKLGIRKLSLLKNEKCANPTWRTVVATAKACGLSVTIGVQS